MHFDLLDIAVFVRAAALGNLSAAARDLALSTSTASARLQRLEEQLVRGCSIAPRAGCR
jgi:DNA-binding transcriptional LysR family regulator